MACVIALSVAAASAGAEQTLPLLRTGAAETAQAIQSAGGDRAEPLQGKAAGEPKRPVTTSADHGTSTASNPEPHTWAFMGAGLLAVAMIRRRMERRR